MLVTGSVDQGVSSTSSMLSCGGKNQKFGRLSQNLANKLHIFFLNQKYPIFEPSGNQSVSDAQKILLPIFPTYMSVPRFYLYTQSRKVLISVPRN